MDDWYTIGLGVGLGVAAGVLLMGFLAGARPTALAAIAAALAAGAGIGFVVDDAGEAIGGALGGLAGAAGAWQVVGGALRAGGTRGATGLLVAGAAVVLAGLAFVPVLGYLEAVALPAVAGRLRRRGGERYAGLRVLR